MFLVERHDAILDILARDGKVRVKDLSDRFHVTEDCIRKDLGALEKQGKLKRTYGGAVIRRENPHAIEVSKHRNIDVEAKRRIARAAMHLIHEHDMVFLDISTSNLAIAELLVHDERELTVVTNMIDILSILAQNPKIRVVFVGGVINKSRDGFWGGMTLDLISRLKPDIAFVGAVGVDVKENSVSTYDIEDGINKAAIIRVSKRAYVVAEARKLSSDGNYNYVTLASRRRRLPGCGGLRCGHHPAADRVSCSTGSGLRVPPCRKSPSGACFRRDRSDVPQGKEGFLFYANVLFAPVFLAGLLFRCGKRTQGISFLPCSPFFLPRVLHFLDA